MSQTQPSLPPIRTYASDLARERLKHGDTSPTPNMPLPRSRAATPPESGNVQAAISNLAAGVLTEAERENISTIPKLASEQPEVPHATTELPHKNEPTPRIEKIEPVSAAPSRPQLPDSIPPYHALKKIHLSEPGSSRVVINDDESGAMVITDTKRNQFSLFSGIMTALRGWFKEKSEAKEKVRIEKNVMPETTRRKEVIQKATTHTALGTISDSSLVREQVRQRLEQPVPEPKPLSPEVVVPTPVSSVVNVVVTSRTNEAEPTEVKPSDEERWEDDTQARPRPVAAPIAETPAPPQGDVRPEHNDDVADAVVSPETSRRSVVLVTIMLLSLVGIGALGALGYLYGNTIWSDYLEPHLPNQTATETTEVAPVSSGIILNLPSVAITTIPNSKTELISSLTATLSTSTVRTEISFASTFGVVPPATLVTLIDPSIDQNLAQSISTIVFGWYDDATPFMVLRVTDRTTALGGLLRSENSLYQALTSFLVRGADTTTPRVIDRTLLGRDVRIFIQPDGSESLVYGFADVNTIIITTNTSAFISLTALVQSPR